MSNNLMKKISNISLELEATKIKSKGLTFRYFQTDDLKTIALRLFSKYSILFTSNQIEGKIKKHQYTIKDGSVKFYSGAECKVSYRLSDIETGEIIDFVVFGYATDFGDGGHCMSKSLTSCFKSFILNNFLVSEKEKMDIEQFYTGLENEGIDKGRFKKAMRILGRETLKKSELEIIFNEVVAIKHLIDRFEIENDDIIKKSWRNLKELTGFELPKIADYFVNTNPGYIYYWPNPALSGADLKPDVNEIEKFSKNGVS